MKMHFHGFPFDAPNDIRWDTPLPARASGEGDASYVARFMAWTGTAGLVWPDGCRVENPLVAH